MLSITPSVRARCGRRLSSSTSILAVTATLMTSAVAAQEIDDEDTVETIIVTGTRFETPLDQVGRSVTIISRDQIELDQQRLLVDSLQTVAGVQVIQSGNLGSLTSVSMRGLPSSQTLVVQDGVVLNDPVSFNGGFNFAGYDNVDVERIEVLRGAQATLYGSNAIGGVINIVTQTGEEGFEADALFEAGAFDTYRINASVRGGSKVFSNRLSVAGISSGGFSAADEANGNTEDDGYESLTISYRGRYKPTDDFSLDAVARYQAAENDFDDFTFQPVDGAGVANQETLSLSAIASWDLFDGLVNNRWTVTYADTDQVNDNEGTTTFDARGTRFSIDYQSTITPNDYVAVIVGAEYEDQESQVSAGFGANQQIDTYSAYGLLQLTPVEGLTLNAGIRHDASPEFRDETTFSVSGAYKVAETGTIIRASFAEGFRAPTAAEFSFNPDLNAEFSEGFDVGIEQPLLDGRVNLSVTYFDQQIEDLIAFDFATFSFLNIQLYDAQGLEIAASAVVTDWLEVAAAYTYTDALNISTNTTVGNVPDDRFRFDVITRPTDKLTFSANITYNGDERSGFGTLDDFVVINARGSYKINDQLEVFARVDNLGDEQYQDNLGFGTAPISAYAGLRASF